MPDYSKGKIYKILNNIDDEIYVGATVEPLSVRLSHHRGYAKLKPHFKLYNRMFELGIENFYIEVIENFPCNDVYELRAREGHFIREIGTLNKYVAGRTTKEYREENKGYYTDYQTDNKERLKELKKSSIMKTTENTYLKL